MTRDELQKLIGTSQDDTMEKIIQSGDPEKIMMYLEITVTTFAIKKALERLFTELSNGNEKQKMYLSDKYTRYMIEEMEMQLPGIVGGTNISKIYDFVKKETEGN